MRFITKLSLRMRSLLRRKAVDAELNEELRSHLERQIAQNLAVGMSREEARYAALREFGGLDQIREECSDMRSVNWLHDLAQDIRYGLRMLRRSAGFTTVTLLTLTLGIGASTAIFSIVNAVLLRPLPFKDPSRLVLLHEGIPKIGLPKMSFSTPDLVVFAREQKSFSVLGTFENEQVDISLRGVPDRVTASRVSATLFPMLGAAPMLGTLFAPEEDAPNHPVAILSYGLWQRRYGGDPDIIGQQIELDRQPHVVIGVMPRDFVFPLAGPEDNGSPADLWVPMAVTPAELQDWGGLYMTSVVGRLRPGVTLGESRAEAGLLAPGILARYPALIGKAIPGVELLITAYPFHEEVVGPVRTLLLVLMGAVVFVLLISCANVATLLLSRAAARQKEMAMRTALGATRSRLARQMLTESLLLALAGGALGVCLSIWARNLMLALVPSSIPLPRHIALSGGVLAFALTGSMLAAILFGVAPALQASAGSMQTPLRETGRSGTASRSRRRVQGIFVTAEFALALVLLMGAGLLIRSFAKLLATSPGFRPDRLLTLNIPIPRRVYSHASQIRGFYQQLLDQTSNLPGVRSVTVSSDLPLHTTEMVSFAAEGQSAQGKGPKAICQTWVIGSYFQTMDVPLIQGRWFGPEDRVDSHQVAVVSAYTAETFWPGENPIGKRVRWGSGPWDTVVGVVGDVKEGPLDSPLAPHVYRPFVQAADGLLEADPFSDWHAMNVVVRTQTDPASLASAVVAQVHALDPDLAVAKIQTMTQVITSSVAGAKFNTFLLGSFAGLALLLAAIGIYGVLAYAVTQQTHEIGIRMALGAQRSGVVRLILTQGARLALIGSGIGAVAAFFLARLMSSLLYGVSPADSVTFAGVVLVLTLVALGASYIPARRAMRIDPMVALRHE